LRRIFISYWIFVPEICESTQGVLTTLTSLVSSGSFSSGVLSVVSEPGIPAGASIATATLLLLLLLRDFLPVSKHWGDAIEASLNMGIVPLLFSFCAIVLYKVVDLF
jgi:hypothetical protein